ncbi:hypothetical protein D1BOALGB6SA_6492 [Olavius sp. associated proteobacterium Delta 1]|nr:hypothetical protein D1BOALGB6SA_6492 [Olavius sp. associated proteobacterium Delta 1]
MDNQIVFIIYLTVFRLAIVTAGITSIFLGYKLFVRGVFTGTGGNTEEGQNVSAEIAGAKFTLRNAAPGTCFALFGAIVIAVMFMTGGPEGTFEVPETGGAKTTLRGDEATRIQSHVELALQQLKRGASNQANLSAYKGLQLLAPQLNDYAWVLLKTSPEAPLAGLLAESAVDINPHDPNFLHTLSEVQFYNGEKKEAIKTLTKAQAIHPAFTDQLARWRSQVDVK